MSQWRNAVRAPKAAWTVVLVVSAGAALSACSSPGGAPRQPGVEADSRLPVTPPTALGRLRARAAQESSAPPPANPQAPIPPGIDPLAVAPLPPDQVLPTTKQGRPLRETLAELGATWKKPVPPAERTPIPQDDKVDAATSYAQARLMLLDQNHAKAIPLLQKASRLDPQSSEVWRELGRAHLAINRKAPGIAALKRAMELGADDPEICYLLGREASRGGNNPEALALLSHTMTRAGAASDPALAFLTTAELADALLTDGRIRAARDAQVAALDLPDSWAGESSFRAELSELYRRRFDLWLRAGDLSCRLGDHAIAREAYERAARTPALDPGMALPRQVFATLRAGQDARAALLVLDAIERAEGRFEDRHAELVKFLSTRTDLGGEVAIALGELGGSLSDRATPSVLARHARVEAGALPPAQARDSLLRAVKGFGAPCDFESVSYLVESFGAAESKELAQTLTKLAGEGPLYSWVLADALLTCGRSVEETLTHLGALAEPAARLLEAGVFVRTGRAARAAERLDSLTEADRASAGAQFSTAWLATRTDVAVTLGDKTTADRCVELLRARAARAALDGGAPDDRLAYALALRSLRDVAWASAVADEASSTPTVFAKLVEADAAMRAANGPRADAALRSAREIDPFAEPVYEAMFLLYSTEEMKGDGSRIAEAARELRQAIPGGRLLRVLTAKDMVARDLFKEAEPVLAELVRQSPPDARAVDLFADLAEKAAKTEPALAARAESLLRGVSSDRPDSPAVLAAFARVLAATGKGREAVDLLATRLSYWPVPELARVRESIIRLSLSDPALADQLARQRLEKAPKSLTTSLELAELLIKAGDIEGAAKAMGEGLALGFGLSAEQKRAVLAILTRLPAEPTSEAPGTPAPATTGVPAAPCAAPASASVRGVLLLFEQALAQGIEVTSPLRVKHLRYATEAYADEPSKLFAAADEAMRSSPEMEELAYELPFQVFLRDNRPDRAMRFAAEVATKAEPWKPSYTAAWLGSIARAGGAADAEALIEASAKAGRLGQIVQLFEDRLELDTERASGEAAQRAEIAYWLAGLMLQADRPEPAIEVYRLSLRYAPEYHIVANDLGYLLLERNESPIEAASLIERAHAGLPDNPNVVDSMGWLRYKQGRFEDGADAPSAPGPSGPATKPEGAITLLQRAVELSEDLIPNDEGHDHLGDALWRAGRQAEAIRAWRRAADLRAQVLEFYRSRRDELGNPMSLDDVRKTEARLTALKQKLEAGAAGGNPATAPIWGEPAPSPAAEGAPAESKPIGS